MQVTSYRYVYEKRVGAKRNIRIRWNVFAIIVGYERLIFALMILFNW